MASEAVAPERRARIRIVIADDHRLVLSGLRAALADAEGIEVVAGGLVFVLVYGVGIVLLGVSDETRELGGRARDRILRRGSTW